MKRGRIVNVGRRTPGMTAIAFDEMEVTDLFGPQVVTLGWDEIEELAEQVSENKVNEQVKRIKSLAARINSSEESLADLARLYLTFREKIHDDDILAYSLGCYPHYAGRVCVVAGLLGDDGIACSCEGDLNSALSMYLLGAFTDNPVHFGEMLEINQEENSIITSHCGCCPSKLACDASQVEITPVRLFSHGTSIRFPAKAGRATYMNIVGRRGTYRMCAVEGQAKVTPMVFEGNPVKIMLDMPVRDLLDVVASRGFGHHWMMGYGHVVKELEYFCRLSGVDGVFPK